MTFSLCNGTMHGHPAQPFPRQPLSRSMNFVSTQVHLVEAHLTMPDCWLRLAIYIRGRTRSDYARHARGLLVNSLRNESVTTLARHPFPSFLLLPFLTLLVFSICKHRALLLPPLFSAAHRSSIFSSRVLPVYTTWILNEFSPIFLSRSLPISIFLFSFYFLSSLASIHAFLIKIISLEPKRR